MNKWQRGMVVLGALLALGAVIASAQTSVAASVYGAFGTSTQHRDAAINTLSAESPSNAVGVSIELRHIKSPLVGYEVTYSYHHAKQKDSYFDYAHACPSSHTSSAKNCSLQLEASIPSNVHEIKGNWVFSFNRGRLRPFALIGGGLLLDLPVTGSTTVSSALTQCIPAQPNPVCTITLASSRSPTKTQMKAVIDYGVGFDWTVLRHIGLRFQYRGDLYKAPTLIKGFPRTDRFTQSFEPEVGVFLRF